MISIPKLKHVDDFCKQLIGSWDPMAAQVSSEKGGKTTSTAHTGATIRPYTTRPIIGGAVGIAFYGEDEVASDGLPKPKLLAS